MASIQIVALHLPMEAAMRAGPEALIGIRLAAAEEPSTSPCGLLVWDIEASEGLTSDAALKAAYDMAVAAWPSPGALLNVSLGGFDDDPRERIDLPKVIVPRGVV